MAKGKSKGKKMGAQLKAFLKREGRFPRKGELAQRGGGGSSRGMSKGKNPGSSNGEKRGLGSAYQGTAAALGFAAPVTQKALEVIDARASPSLDTVRDLVRNRILTPAYGVNVLIEGATAIVDKKMGQAAALSRGSVTAIVPEVFLGAVVADEARVQGRLSPTMHQRWSKARNAYDPSFNAIAADKSEFFAYRIGKHGGQVFRKIRTRSAKRGGIIAKVTDKIGDFVLKPLGLTW